jgi:hypothetical protein
MVLTALAVFGCSDGGSSSSGASTGICTGVGWRDTCDFLMTSSGGRFELFCSAPSDPELEAALSEAGVELDGNSCVCVVDEHDVTEVDFTDDRPSHSKMRIRAGWLS